MIVCTLWWERWKTVKSWHSQFWNLTLFCSNLACQVLCSQVLTVIELVKTRLSKSWNLLGVPNFKLRPTKELWFSWLGLPRQEKDCQDLVNQFPKSEYYYVQDLACQVLCNSMFPSLDNDCIWLHYSRLGFPSLESFWGK